MSVAPSIGPNFIVTQPLIDAQTIDQWLNNFLFVISEKLFFGCIVFLHPHTIRTITVLRPDLLTPGTGADPAVVAHLWGYPVSPAGSFPNYGDIGLITEGREEYYQVPLNIPE